MLDRDVATPQGPPEGWLRWMLDQIERADWVFVVCNAFYYDRFRGRQRTMEGGLGSTFESAVIGQEIYADATLNRKFIPVLLEGDSTSHIPEPLRGATYYRIPADFDKLTTAVAASTASNRRSKATTSPVIAPSAPPLIAAYLEQIAADHNRLVPYFQQKAELNLLDRVYVRLEVRADSSTLTSSEMSNQRWSQALGIREVLEQSPQDFQWITGKWVIRGDPGAGKTTLLRSLAAELAKDPTTSWIPVLDSLPRLLRKREWILNRVVRRLHLSGFQGAESLGAILELEGKKGKLLLLLDGLDEVAKEEREDAESLLHGLINHWPQTPVVVTSRPIGYRRPHADFRELELLPLDKDRRREFLGRWFGRRRGENERARAEIALAALEDDPNLWDLSGNPLYLTLMALLLEEGRTLQTNRSQLYRQVFDFLLSGKHKPEPQPLEHKEAVLKALQYLAFSLTRENRDAEGESALAARLYDPRADSRRKPLEQVPRWSQGLLPFFEDVADRTGILGPHDGYEADWRFWHRTFREALAAEELEQRWKVGGAEAILACAREISGEESRWAEPYALLAGSVTEPDALVRALVKENRALGLRALATAQGLKKETITEVLQLTTDDVEARGRIFQRLPELIGDGERALLLIDRLRRGTTNGNDLFFLTLAVNRVARMFPDYSNAAETLLGRFYDHIPTPASSSFRSVVTGLDGTVDLWQQVPAGTFWMGSRDNEGEENEHPCHRVKLPHGFWISVVPLTNQQYAVFDPAMSGVN